MLVYSNVRRTIGFSYKSRYGVRTQYSTRSSDLPLIERGAPTSAEDALLLYINHRVRRQRVRGSNAPRKKSVSPAGSTRTKRNLLRVTPTILLQRAGGTRSTFTFMRPAPAVYFYFLRVRPTVLLLRAGGTRRTQLLSCSRHQQQVYHWRAALQISIQQYINL
jgi:hypothetical protein